MRKKVRKLELSRETLRTVASGKEAPIGGGTFSCLTCYISCAHACDTDIYCRAAD